CLVEVPGVLDPPHATATIIATATTPKNLSGICPILVVSLTQLKAQRGWARIARSRGLYTRILRRSGRENWRVMNAVEVIGRKRDGLEHSAEEIQFLLAGYVRGDIPDYQMAA